MFTKHLLKTSLILADVIILKRIPFLPCISPQGSLPWNMGFLHWVQLNPHTWSSRGVSHTWGYCGDSYTWGSCGVSFLHVTQSNYFKYLQGKTQIENINGIILLESWCSRFALFCSFFPLYSSSNIFLPPANEVAGK